MLNSYRRDGRLYGLPYTVNMHSLIYNHAAFEAAGVQPPRADWTPEDFLAAARALTRGAEEDPRWGYMPLGHARDDLLFFISQFGARLMVGEGKDLRPNFTDPKTIAAIRWYLDLSMVHKVAPRPKFAYWLRDLPEGPSSYWVQSGRVGMSLGHTEFLLSGISWQQLGPPPVEERDIRAAPLPVGAAGAPPGEIRAHGLFISARAQQPQACWEWFKFLSGRATLPRLGIPARHSVTQSEAFIAQMAPWQVAQFETTQATLAIPSKNATDPNLIYSRYSDPYWFFKALTAVVEEGADLEKELAEAQRMTTAYIECRNQPDGKPATCATQADPEYRGFNVEN